MTTTLARAVEQVLGTRVSSAVRLPQGGVNQVYRVETAEGPVVVKVFSYGTWPEVDKPPWVEQQLQDHGVQHARTLYYSRADTYFPCGLMISEFVEGANAFDALRARRLSLTEYATKLGWLLRQVHRIPVARYGYLNGGAGMYESFVEFKLTHAVREQLAALPAGALPAGLDDRIAALAGQKLAPLEARLRPVLVHDDAQPKNVIWTAAGVPVLIDWDEVVAGAWLSDYARLTYWLAYQATPRLAPRERHAFSAAFFLGYGAVELSAEEIAAAEHTLHVIYAIDLSAFHFTQQDEAAFARVRACLLRLLG